MSAARKGKARLSLLVNPSTRAFLVKYNSQATLMTEGRVPSDFAGCLAHIFIKIRHAR
jgi:hypothetical protein